jgi:hypothetical protein
MVYTLLSIQGMQCVKRHFRLFFCRHPGQAKREPGSTDGLGVSCAMDPASEAGMTGE